MTYEENNSRSSRLSFKNRIAPGFRTLREFAESCLEGDDYDRGALEAARAQADKASLALIRLCEVLIDKDIISPKEVYFIFTACQPDDDEIKMSYRNKG